MSEGFFSPLSTRMKVLAKSPAESSPSAVINSTSNDERSVTNRPFEHKESVRCVFCRGPRCRRCGKDAYLLCRSPVIEYIHSSWITDQILAMQRPADEHFVNHRFVEQLKEKGIVAVFNLQEPGEHHRCGFGIKSSGFSYFPEKLMAEGSKLNF